jgi:CheY-like chemotaxis protein
MSKTILVIDDDPDILDIMVYILKDEGYEVSGSAVCLPIEKILQAEPTLILMDNRLLGSSGKDECRKLKGDPATRHIPIILVSANSQLQELAQDSKADGYISKPFDLDELVTVVRQYTGG